MCARRSKSVGVLVDFNAKSINRYYNLELVNPEAYDRLHENPNYPEVLRMLTNLQGEWKLNNEGHAVHFRANEVAPFYHLSSHSDDEHLRGDGETVIDQFRHHSGHPV